MRSLTRTINYWLPSGVTQQQATLHYGNGLPAPWLQKWQDRAIATIQQWLQASEGQVCHYFSAGKDSLVAGHLIRQVLPDCPIAWVNQGPMAEWPDCLLLIDHLKAAGWNIVEVCPPRSLWNLYKDYGIPIAPHMGTTLDAKINEALMYRPIAQYEEQHRITGYAWGLRRESKGREKFLSSKGTLYRRQDGRYICSPVGFWSTKEIWQYIDAHQLPYPAMYDRDRMTVRNGPPIGTTGVNRGRLSNLRLYHPDLWAEFVAEFPELRNHSG